MTRYVRMHKLRCEGSECIGEFKKRLSEIRHVQETMGVREVLSCATIGEFDFVSVVDAPDEDTICKVNERIDELLQAVTLSRPAIPADDFAELAEEF